MNSKLGPNVSLIFQRLGLDIQVSESVSLKSDVTIDLYIAVHNARDFYLYMDLDFDQLVNVCRDLQISLSSKLVNLIKQSGIDCTTTEMSSIEKNSTLIIGGILPQNFSDRDIQKIIDVEEDPYFFKKQLLYMTEEQFDSMCLKFDEHHNDILDYLNLVISNTDLFVSHVNDINVQYAFVSKLYEKIPLLRLVSETKQKENLSEKIRSSLIEGDADKLDTFLALDSDDINGWIESICEVKEND